MKLRISKIYPWCIGLSIVLIIAGAVIVGIKGVKFNIDFIGGSLFDITLDHAVENQELSKAFSDSGHAASVVQPISTSQFIVKTVPLNEEEHQAVLKALKNTFGSIQENRFESIGPTVGQELRRKAITSLLLVSAGIVLYIAYAFRKIKRPVSNWVFGAAAIIALLHDLAMTFLVYVIAGYSLGLSIDVLLVTALLTILGFSVHDTIVIFDRIRENVKVLPDQNLADIVDTSVSQTITRSLSTTVTILLPLIALVFFGGETVKGFSIALAAGIFSGAYSSIFIASPLLMVLQRRK